jgi:hypothetical protein
MSSVEAMTPGSPAGNAFGDDLAPYAAEMIAVAQSSIRHGLASRTARPVSIADFPPALGETMASFVTLRIEGELRGCIGTAFACRPLVEDLSHNGFMAAFHDPRFPPLTVSEFGATGVEVSVLSPPAPFPFDDEDDLLARLVPGRDGLILEHGARRGLFLPQVWESLPDPVEFLRYLKRKAGLPDAPLKPGVRARRFVAAKFADDAAA